MRKTRKQTKVDPDVCGIFLLGYVAHYAGSNSMKRPEKTPYHVELLSKHSPHQLNGSQVKLLGQLL